MTVVGSTTAPAHETLGFASGSTSVTLTSGEPVVVNADTATGSITLTANPCSAGGTSSRRSWRPLPSPERASLPAPHLVVSLDGCTATMTKAAIGPNNTATPIQPTSHFNAGDAGATVVGANLAVGTKIRTSSAARLRCSTLPPRRVERHVQHHSAEPGEERAHHDVTAGSNAISAPGLRSVPRRRPRGRRSGSVVRQHQIATITGGGTGATMTKNAKVSGTQERSSGSAW